MFARLGLKVPKEHGAWAMLYVPFALGGLAAGRVSWALLGTFLAVTALFFSRETLRRLRRARQRGQTGTPLWRGLSVEVLVLMSSGALLLLRHPLWGFLPLGAVALALLLFNLERTEQREERSIPSQLLAVVGFAMSAPAAHYAALGEWTSEAMWLWLLAWLYFASSVFHVKMRVLGAHASRRAAFVSMRRISLAYHAGLLFLLVLLARLGRIPPWVLLGFAPLWIRTMGSLVHPAPKLDLRRIGISEIFYSLNFLFFGWLAYLG